MLMKLIVAASAVWGCSLWSLAAAYRDAPLLPDDVEGGSPGRSPAWSGRSDYGEAPDVGPRGFQCIRSIPDMSGGAT